MAAQRVAGREQTERAAAQRQALHREVNERIEEIAETFDLSEAIPILCECGSVACSERVELSRAEYERLRGMPTHFAVLPGHDLPAIERVVDENERYLVVEKFGESAVAVIRLDPRRPPSAV